MARLWSSGFELNSTTANVEWTSTSGGGTTVQTSIVRNGTYAGRVTSLVSSSGVGFAYQFAAAGSGPYFFRFYVSFATLPTAENTIFKTAAATTFGATPVMKITIDNSGALRLYNATTLIGSPSSALSTNVWYCIEAWYDKSPAAGSQVMKARIDQAAEFASATNLTILNGLVAVMFGANLTSEAQTTGDLYFDDIAINDSTGTTQTSYPGAGSIVHLQPNAAGDNNGFAGTAVGGTAGATNNYTRVLEVTPDDATTYNLSSAANQIDDFNIVNTPTAIGSGDTITLVQVGTRKAGSSVSISTGSYNARIKASSGGTVTSGTVITGTTSTATTFRTNTDVAPFNYQLTSTVQPGTATAWTKAALDTAQIGYTNPTSNANTKMSSVWALVEYVPAVATVNLKDKFFAFF